jgi:hypothetical protein
MNAAMPPRRWASEMTWRARVVLPDDPEGGVEGERAGWNGRDVDLLPAAEAHDRALAELLVDLGEGGLDRLGPLGLVFCHESFSYRRRFP